MSLNQSITIHLYMAVSTDGFIARKNGDEDYLSTNNWDIFTELAEESESFVIGRKTYEAVESWENHSYKNVDADRLVLTKNPEYELPDAYEKVQSPLEAVSFAKEKENDLIVTGGSEVNKSFFDIGLIDKVTLSIEPKIIGKGKNILSEPLDVDLEFVRSENKCNVFLVEYNVV